jgi:two-component system OmpR family sensor kinase
MTEVGAPRRRTTVRIRLILALALIFSIGLVGFGFVTTSLYSRSQNQQLAAQLESVVPAVSVHLTEAAGLNAPSGSDGAGSTILPTETIPQQLHAPGGQGGPPPIVIAPGTFGELLSRGGVVLASLQVSASIGTPEVPTSLPAHGQSVTVPAKTGSSSWLLTTSDGPDGTIVVVAVPTAGVDSSLAHLITIEVITGLILLLLLGAAAYLLISSALRPLESMAETATAIAGGDLRRRVEVETTARELDDLRRALNTMLDEIELSFAQREATELRLRQFLADASHELRTPLTSITGFAEVLGMEGADKEDAELAAERIKSQSARMARLVDDLLTLARLDERRAVPVGSVDLSLVAADACTDAAAIDRTRSIRLSAEEPVEVTANEDHIRQAVANLMGNVLRHTPEGSPVEVKVSRDATNAILTVRDHGPGIPDESLAKIFDRFYQIDPSRTGSGSGLGLSIVGAIIEELHGSVAVENVSDGGCRFTFQLPLAPVESDVS